MATQQKFPYPILLVEDNPGDVRLMDEAFGEHGPRCDVRVVRDGVEAMDYLRRRGTHAGEPRPALIILDLNLPRKDGREVLAEVKADPHLRSIPVVVFSSSRSPQDILKAYDLGANCYIFKPLDLEGFMNAIGAMLDFWFKVATLTFEVPE